MPIGVQWYTPEPSQSQTSGPGWDWGGSCMDACLQVYGGAHVHTRVAACVCMHVVVCACVWCGGRVCAYVWCMCGESVHTCDVGEGMYMCVACMGVCACMWLGVCVHACGMGCVCACVWCVGVQKMQMPFLELVREGG